MAVKMPEICHPESRYRLNASSENVALTKRERINELNFISASKARAPVLVSRPGLFVVDHRLVAA